MMQSLEIILDNNIRWVSIYAWYDLLPSNAELDNVVLSLVCVAFTKVDFLRGAISSEEGNWRRKLDEK